MHINQIIVSTIFVLLSALKAMKQNVNMDFGSLHTPSNFFVLFWNDFQQKPFLFNHSMDAFFKKFVFIGRYKSNFQNGWFHW